MKKLISLLCVLSLVIGIVAVSTVAASAAEPAKTIVDVKKGNTVTYVLKLSGVKTPIVGCEYSIYFDSSVLQVDSVLDFNDKGEDEWLGSEVINPDLNGEVRGNWSIIKGSPEFNDQRNFITINFKAISDGSTDISYFVRYMYDNSIFSDESRPQITDYKFTCDVTVSGDKVLEEAQPELNVEETQKSGLFVNSITGDSKDADADIPGTVAKKNANSNSAPKSVGNGNDNNVYNNDSNNGGSGSGNGSGSGSGGSAVGQGSGSNASSNGNGTGGAANANSGASSEGGDVAPPATTAEGYFIIATDAEGNVTATSDEAPAPATADNAGKSGSKKVLLWVILALIVVIGGGAAGFFYFTKKKSSDHNTPGAPAAPADAPTEALTEAEASVATDAGEAKTELLDEGEAKTELLDEGEAKTELLDEGEAKTELLDEGDEKTQLLDENASEK